jgi:hypothetical protein
LATLGGATQIGSLLFSILCHAAQGGSCVSLSLMVSPTNFANVNEPLSSVYTSRTGLAISLSNAILK